MNYLKQIFSVFFISSSLLFTHSLKAVNFPENDQLPSNCIIPNDADAGWLVTTQSAEVFAGSASLRSAAVGEGETAAIECRYDSTLLINSFQFAYRVDTALLDDKLVIYINGIPQTDADDEFDDIKFSGQLDWTTISFPLIGEPTNGEHVIRWSFERVEEPYYENALNTVWIDSVVIANSAFPPIADAAFSPQASLPAGFTLTDWEFSNDDSSNDAGFDGLVSGSLGDNETASIQVENTFTEDTLVTFDIRVSSEERDIKPDGTFNGDFLRFYIDGVLVEVDDEALEWSGEVDWEKIQVTVPAGTESISWRYEKDASISEGADRAYVDNISLQNDKETEIDLPINYTIDEHNEQPSWLLDETEGSPFDSGSVAFTTATILDNGTATLNALTDFFTSETSVTFAIKVSSEEDADFLQFYIDDELLESYEQLNDELDEFVALSQAAAWSGELDWTVIRVVVPAGQHTLSWRYAKSASGQAGDDQAWVDMISLPASVPFLRVSVVNDEIMVAEGETVTLDASISQPALGGLASDLSYSWVPVRDDGIEFSALDEPTLTFTAPEVSNTAAGAQFVFFVTVTDSSVEPPVSKSQRVNVLVSSLDQTSGIDDEFVDDSGSFNLVWIAGLLLSLAVFRRRSYNV